MNINQAIALGASAAAKHIAEAGAKLDSDGCPTWPPTPSESEWRAFNARPDVVDESLAYAFAESYEAVSMAAASTVAGW
ncbi:MAG: hypothetical protein GY720_01640 [bacterium]|nr:hypothetical protein [bacterium]